MAQRHDHRMYSGNRFKLGLFALNCSGGLTMTKAPERWEASWDNNLKAARISEEGRPWSSSCRLRAGTAIEAETEY